MLGDFPGLRTGLSPSVEGGFCSGVEAGVPSDEFTGGKLATGAGYRLNAAQRPERIIPAPTVSLVDSSIRMKLPVVLLRA